MKILCITRYRQYLRWEALFHGSSIMSCLCVRLYPGHRTPRVKAWYMFLPTECKSLFQQPWDCSEYSLFQTLYSFSFVNDEKLKINSWMGRYGGGVIGPWYKPIRSEVYQEPITSPPITPPGKLFFDWLRDIQDYKKRKFDPKKMEWNSVNSIRFRLSSCWPTKKLTAQGSRHWAHGNGAI